MEKPITKKDLAEITLTFTVTLKVLIDRMTTLTNNMNDHNQLRRGERDYRNRVLRGWKYHV